RKKTDLMEEIPFFPTIAFDSLHQKSENKADASEDKLYECPETRPATEEFQSQSDLDLHMNMFDHQHNPAQLPVEGESSMIS
ncbi:hypothetical protein OS493_037451, partial [Desmophyllum pertusum]